MKKLLQKITLSLALIMGTTSIPTFASTSSNNKGLIYH